MTFCLRVPKEYLPRVKQLKTHLLLVVQRK
jgi:hypothetical protein